MSERPRGRRALLSALGLLSLLVSPRVAVAQEAVVDSSGAEGFAPAVSSSASDATFPAAVRDSAGAAQMAPAPAVESTAFLPSVHYEFPEVPAVEGQPSPIRYRIQASVDGGDLEGEESIEIDPVGAAKLDDVVLFLFPNILAKPLAGIDSKTFYWVNPARWHAGGMTLLSITDDDGTDLPWTGVDLTRRNDQGDEVELPAFTAVRVTLPGEADGPVHLRARFHLHVPVRFGTFSRYDGELFLDGGWYPAVAPRDASGRWDVHGLLPRADAHVTIDAPTKDWVVLDRTVSAPPPAPADTVARDAVPARRTVEADVWSRPSVLLAVSRRMTLTTAPATGVSVLERRHNRFYAKRILDVASRVHRYLADRSLFDPDTPAPVLHEAPLSRELVYPDAPIGVVSQRIYRVFPPLRKYEDVQLARATIAADLRDTVYAREPGSDAHWVLDLVSWALSRQWQKDARHLRDVRDFVKPLGFIPAVDIVLHRPDFPFAAEFYDNFYYTDFLRDDPMRFNHDLMAGKIVWEKLIDLEGPETADRILQTYLTHGYAGGFRAVAQEVVGRDLSSFFEQWRAPLPLVNYRLKKIHVRRDANGAYVSDIRVVREGTPIDEPVPIRLTLAKGYRWVRWDSSEGEGTATITTPTRPKSWLIDANKRLYQTSLADDRIPPTWQTFLQYAYVNYDFKLNKVDGAAGLTFERTNDLRNEVLLDAFYNQQSTGADVGYSHSAGRFSFYRGLLHRYGFLLIAQHLDKSFGKKGLHVIPGFDPTLSDVHDTSSIQVFYRYDSRDDWRFPKGGSRFYAFVESGRSVQGRPATFHLANAELVHLQRVTDNNVLALQLKAGTFLGTSAKSVPLSKLFFLGGIDDVRGISPPDIVGPARFMGTLEWRHWLLHDVDWNFWLERMRGLQGTLFVDSGYIAPRADVVPAMDNWVTSVGYGVREAYDFFGVRPQLLRLEIAQRVDHQSIEHFRSDFRFYIGAGQSF